MTQETGSPGTQVLDWVAHRLEAEAKHVDLASRRSPELVGDTFVGASGQPSSCLEPRDLPMVRLGVTIGRHAIVLGLLPETIGARDIADSMRQYRNQCVVARSALAPNAVLDLLLIMIGPRGSEGKDAWRAIALAVERDDRVARKLVWLRPSNAEADQESFAAFIKRSFLARPWVTNATFSVASLDEVSTAVEIAESPRDTAGQWNKLAVLWGEEPDTLVDRLVEAWKERSAI
jgi:hypothetical protein